MERKSVGFEQLSEIVRVSGGIGQAWRSAIRRWASVHTTWPMVPGRFTDYVSTPKQNDIVRSTHADRSRQQRVDCRSAPGRWIEIAEYGIAAHALYKDGVGSPTEMPSRESSAYAWLRRTNELLARGSNPEEFLEHTKLELFHDQCSASPRRAS